MRYQFYREHKYVSHALNEVERLIAKTDFSKNEECLAVEKAFNGLAEMLSGHAAYENERLHALLKKRASTVFEHAEKDHEEQEVAIHEIQKLIQEVVVAQDPDEKIDRGYTLYLTYRKFVADNLIHLHEEETKILPELQRLYTDDELRQVEQPTYSMMTVDELNEMLTTLLPHMNASDKQAVLNDIQALEPAKFDLLTRN